MQKKMTDRTPGSYDDFVAYLGTVRKIGRAHV